MWNIQIFIVKKWEKYILPDRKMYIIVHYATSAMKRFLTSVSLQHEPKASDVITLVKKTFFARVSYEILYHEVWNKIFYHTVTSPCVILILIYRFVISKKKTKKCTYRYASNARAFIKYVVLNVGTFCVEQNASVWISSCHGSIHLRTVKSSGG